jgi:hypothetical protein
MKKILITTLTLLALSACSHSRNLNDNLSGTDKLIPSPCAGCEDLDYRPPEFKFEVKNG